MELSLAGSAWTWWIALAGGMVGPERCGPASYPRFLPLCLLYSALLSISNNQLPAWGKLPRSFLFLPCFTPESVALLKNPSLSPPFPSGIEILSSTVSSSVNLLDLRPLRNLHIYLPFLPFSQEVICWPRTHISWLHVAMEVIQSLMRFSRANSNLETLCAISLLQKSF